MTTLKLNAWELLAIEQSLALLKASGSTHAASLDALIAKVGAATPPLARGQGDIKIGARVRTLVAKDEPMIGIDVPAGATGEIVDIEQLNACCILSVKLDKHFDDLDEWENVLHFYIEDEGAKLADYVSVTP
jgi:hypothetical protein